MPFLETIAADTRYAVRAMACRPTFAATAVLTLAIGLGTMTIAFSAVNAFFFAPAPVEGTGTGLVTVTDSIPESSGASPLELDTFAREVTALEIAGQTMVMLSHRRGDTTDVAWGLAVTDNYFDVVGARAARGRTFRPGDGLSAVISHRFWDDRLGRVALAGLTLRLNGADVPILGVLAEDFRAGFYDAGVWVRLRDSDVLRLPARLRRPDAFAFTLLARLRPGATDALANHQLRQSAQALATAWPATNARRAPAFVSFDDGIPERRMLAVVAAAAMAMIAIVLAIAVFNVAGLLLARAADREHEMSLRAALGASRARLTRLLVTESLVIAALGGALGLLVALWSNDLLAAFALEAPVPQRLDVTPDWRVALFAGTLVAICGASAGMVSARRAMRLDITATMAPPTAAGGARGSRRREAIVALQLAGATLLVTLAALLVRNAVLTADRPVGFDRELAVVLELDPASHGYDERGAARLADALLDRIRTLPGVVSAAAADRLPFYVGFPERVAVAGDAGPCAERVCPPVASYRVGPGYFSSMGIALRYGRESSQSPEDADAVVVSEAMARRYWPAGDPLGRQVRLGDGRRFRVVGVAADVVHRAVGETVEPYIYLPLDEAVFARPLAFVIRTREEPSPLLPVIAEQVRELDADLPVYRLRTMRQRLEAREQAGALIVARFFTICAALALCLATIGVGGTMAYAVGKRMRELGIRAAVGAAPIHLLRLVAGQTLRMTVPGILAGLAGAAALASVVRSRVTGMDIDSPMTFVMTGTVLTAVALVAALVPCRRAATVDPVATLRAE